MVQLPRIAARTLTGRVHRKAWIAVEESDEAVGWLEFLRDGEISADNALLAEAKEICAILTECLTNSRANGA